MKLFRMYGVKCEIREEQSTAVRLQSALYTGFWYRKCLSGSVCKRESTAERDQSEYGSVGMTLSKPLVSSLRFTRVHRPLERRRKALFSPTNAAY